MKIAVFVLFALLLVIAACTPAPASRKTPSAPSSSSGAQNVSTSGGDTNTSAAAGDAAKGKTLFTSSCTSCHGPDAKGLPGLGKDLVTSEFVASQSDAELLAFIKKGRPVSDPANTTQVDMPPKGGNPALTDANLDDIIAFIRSIHQ
ncbi:MAG: cytochrome c [Anaerolineae bacterium]|nr:cytochrome c [Anaerolineae bacterium]